MGIIALDAHSMVGVHLLTTFEHRVAVVAATFALTLMGNGQCLAATTWVSVSWVFTYAPIA